jgi:uncharacterized membrane protein
MNHDQFRHRLRQEAELWQAEGLISSEQHRQLAERYQFDSLESVARNRFIAIFIGLGGILIGLATITFVAANWQAWSRDFKVALLLSVFVAINAAGFYLWRIYPKTGPVNSEGWQQRLGHALLLVGALMLGANMALMAQMFHIGGSAWGLYLAWGMGVLAMAFSLRLTSLGVLSLILVGIGYWMSIFDWWRPAEDESVLLLLVEHLPLVLSVLFVPLAYWCRSRVIFTLAAIGIVFSLEMSLAPVYVSLFGSSQVALGWIVAVACVLPPALLWGYDDTIWPRLHSRWFSPLARNLALWFLSFLFYWLSFSWFWEIQSDASTTEEMLLSWTPLVDVVLLGGLTVFEWLRLGRMGRKHPTRHAVDLTTNTIACFLAISALVPLWHFSISPIGWLGTFLFNVLLFLLAAGLMREGLALASRQTFWGGIVLLTLQIFSRMLEYNTELIFKAFVFLLCGVGAIVAGLWFERYSKDK